MDDPMKKKVGLIGGTFDPIHLGHLNMAIGLMESAGLDEVLFSLTPLSPFKTSNPPLASLEHRRAMLQLALVPIPNFSILDGESEVTGPAYTIDTVRRLTQNSSLEVHLLIGEDHASSFTEWKDYEEILRLAPPLVASRMTQMTRSESSIDLKRCPIPLFDISSTTIRERLSQKKYCGHLLPALVLDYIERHAIYS
ncbi:MAG: nicotinate (nicotinamide) nucleotide adenylyltransferase [Chlamydiota bacterium]